MVLNDQPRELYMSSKHYHAFDARVRPMYPDFVLTRRGVNRFLSTENNWENLKLLFCGKKKKTSKGFLVKIATLMRSAEAER